MKKKLSILILFFLTINAFAQQDTLLVEPPNWWVGMQDNNLQLLVYYPNISDKEISIKSKLVKLINVNKVESKNYVFIDLEINDKAKSGTFDIVFSETGKTQLTYSYELKDKSNQERGFNTSDFIYLVMPDRFANGNTENDFSKETYQNLDRKDPHGRHGGDIQGIIDNLDYIKDLGATALWVNPTLENNTKIYSYHGYGITNFYKTDQHFGTNQDYLNLANKCHEKGMKIIMDMVFNHTGDTHWWMNDLPEKSWLNVDSGYKTNYRGSTIVDPYASKFDADKMVAGWFVARMPDLNQHNKYLANYLIQNSIWWIEFAGLDAIRMDTQPYAYKDFMATWAERVHLEYPDFTLLGETWLNDVANVSYFKSDTKIESGYNSGLNTITDFPLYYAVRDAFNEDDGWASGLAKLYSVLAQDFLYGNAYTNVTFIDNHDVDRYFSSVGENVDKYIMGVGFMLTTRGIPSLYYGDEILMTGTEWQGHPEIRKDFPGGWKEDPINAFLASGRTENQNRAFDFIKVVANYRKTSKPIIDGKLMHFIPENNLYVYFRYTDSEAVMVILNNNNSESRKIEKSKYNEILVNYSSGKNIVSGELISDLNNIEVPKKSITIIELKK